MYRTYPWPSLLLDMPPLLLTWLLHSLLSHPAVSLIPPLLSSASYQAMTSSESKVVIVGSINQDLVSYAPSLPTMGQTILGTDFRISSGGKGANQAVAAASIGVVAGTSRRTQFHQKSHVYLIGRVGNDDMGTSLLQTLVSRQVQIGPHGMEHAIVPQTHTGVASIVVDTQSGQNAIVVSPGANLALSPQEVASDLMQLLSTAPNGKKKHVVLVQLEIHPDAALEALKTASHLGAITILNPAPAPKGWSLSDEWYSYIDILIPNETELISLCKDTCGDANKMKQDGDEEEALAKSLLDRGVRQAVIVTLGARGAMIVRRPDIPKQRDDQEERIAKTITEPSNLPFQTLPVVDTVGAGDAFCGALAAYLSQGVDWELAVSMSCGVASMSVRKRGAQESYPREEELPQCLRLQDSSIVKDTIHHGKQRFTITFVTGNTNKLVEVQRLFSTSNSQTLPVLFDIVGADLTLPVLQGSPTDIALQKCQLAVQQVQGPVMIEDTSLGFHALNGLPGPYIKWFLEGVGYEGLNKMLDGFNDDRCACAQTIIAFCAGPGKTVKLFKGQTKGKIVESRGNNNFGWNPIFQPLEGGGKTYAEMNKDEKNAISHRGKAFEKFRQYLESSSQEILMEILS